MQVDNLNVNGNAITATNTNGDITLTPDGTGEVTSTKVFASSVVPTNTDHLVNKAYADTYAGTGTTAMDVYQYTFDSNFVLSYSKDASYGSSATFDVTSNDQWYFAPSGQPQTPSINNNGHFIINV